MDNVSLSAICPYCVTACCNYYIKGMGKILGKGIVDNIGRYYRGICFGKSSIISQAKGHQPGERNRKGKGIDRE